MDVIEGVWEKKGGNNNTKIFILSNRKNQVVIYCHE